MPDKDTFRQWLAAGEIERVADELPPIVRKKGDRYLIKEADLLVGRFNNLKIERNKGTTGNEFYHLELNKIHVALQDLIEKIPDGPDPPTISPSGNAKEVDLRPVEGSAIQYDPTPAHATGQTPDGVAPPADLFSGKITHPCLLALEKQLRNMASFYFDDNRFERPAAPGAFFVQSYLTLQSAELKRIEAALRALSPDNHDFFRPVKALSRDLQDRCSQLSALLANRPCQGLALSESLQNTSICLELLEEALPNLILSGDTATKTSVKSGYLIPLADRVYLLAEEMANFDGNLSKAEYN